MNFDENVSKGIKPIAKQLHDYILKVAGNDEQIADIIMAEFHDEMLNLLEI